MKKNPIALILLVLFVVLGVESIVFYYLNRTTNVALENIAQPVATTTKNSDPSEYYRYWTKDLVAIIREAKKMPTTDWKVYTDDNYGFEFKYPPNFTLIEREGLPKRVSIYRDYNDVHEGKDCASRSVLSLTVLDKRLNAQPIPTDKEKALDQLLSSLKYWEGVVIGNNTVFAYREPGMCLDNHLVYSSPDGRHIVMHITWGVEDYTNIISTLKFTK